MAQHLFFKYAHIDVRQCVFNSQEQDERPYSTCSNTVSQLVYFVTR